MEGSKLWLVQVWHGDDGRLRGTALDVGPQRQMRFDDEAALARCLRSSARPADAPPLTVREREVALCFAAGRSHKQIAAQLGLAPATVRNHLAACYRKLGVANRGALLAALGAASTPPERRETLVHLHPGHRPAAHPDGPATLRWAGPMPALHGA